MIHLSKETKSKRFEGVYFRDLSNGDRSYFLRIRIEGKVKRIPIGKKSEGITEAFCNQEKIRIINAARFGEDAARELQKVKKEDPTFSELLDYFLGHSGIKDTTKRGLKILYKAPFKNERRISAQMIQDYLDEQAKRLRPATVSLRSRQIKQVLRYAIKRGKYTYPDPTSNLDLPKGTGGRQRFFTPQEMQTLLDSVKDKPHLYLFVKVAMCTGARLTTILTIKREDISPDGTIRLKNHKANRWYVGFLDQETMGLIEGANGYIFAEPKRPNEPPRYSHIQRPLLDVIDRLFNKFSTPVEERAVIHTIRHSVATNLLENGVDLIVVSKILDHHSPTVTASIYSHVSTEMKRKSVSKMWQIY